MRSNIFVQLLLAGLVLGCASTPMKLKESNTIVKTGDPSVLILYVSDLHSQLRPGKDGVGGYATLKAWIENEKANVGAKTDVLVLAGGDLVGKGSLPCQLTNDKDCLPLLKELGIQYSALGNYELYNKVADLQKLSEASGIVFLGANVLLKNRSGALAGPWSRDPVYFKGPKSGIGFWLSSWTMPGDVSAYDVQAFPSESDWLRLKQKAGDESVIFLTHQEMAQDEAFLKEACQHLGQSSANPIHGKSNVIGLFKANDHHEPRMKMSACDAPILEAGPFGNTGLRFFISQSKKLHDFKSIDPVVYTPNASLKTKIDALYSRLAPNADEVLVKNLSEKSTLDLAKWTADSFRFKTRADVAIVNEGYVKNALAAGDVTREDFFLTMPYTNKLFGLDWAVKDLEKSLCQASRRAVDSQLDHGSQLAISGLKLEDAGTPKCHVSGTRKSNVKVVVDSYMLSRAPRWLGADIKNRVFNFGVDSRRISMLYLENSKNLEAQK